MPDRHMRFIIDQDMTVRLDGGTPGQDEWPCNSLGVAEKIALRHAARSASAEGDEVHVTLETPDGETEYSVTADGAEPIEATVRAAGTSDPEARERVEKSRIILPNRDEPPTLTSINDMLGGASRQERSRGEPSSVLDRLRAVPLPGKIAAGVVLAFLLATLLSLPFLKRGGDTSEATSTPAAATTPVLPDGCLGGADVIAGARAAGPLASSSTITQNGLTVPSPSGAAAAAAAYARLRSTLPVPPGRDAAVASILAPDATPAARQAIPAAPGWETHLDMSRARWRVVSGDGQSAGIDLLLTSVGKQNGKAADPAQFAVHVDLTLVDGQWRLKNVGAPRDTNALSTAPSYKNVEACS